jgi:hypothetical protein
MSESKPTYYAKDGWVRMRNQDMDLSACQANDSSHVLAETIARLMNQGEVMPELLAALEDMLTALAMGPLEIAAKYGPDSHLDEDVIDAAHKARAALAKAREVAP